MQISCLLPHRTLHKGILFEQSDHFLLQNTNTRGQSSDLSGNNPLTILRYPVVVSCKTTKQRQVGKAAFFLWVKANEHLESVKLASKYPSSFVTPCTSSKRILLGFEKTTGFQVYFFGIPFSDLTFNTQSCG